MKRLRLPHVFVLLFEIIFLCSIASFIIPSGEYRRETRTYGELERTVVLPGTYASIPKSYSIEGVLLGESPPGSAAPVSAIQFLSAVPRGLVEAADIVFMVFIVGGVFGILHASGTVGAVLQKLLTTFRHRPRVLVILLMSVLSLGASTLGMSEEFIPLIPLFLLVSRELGYDRIFGFAVVIVAAEVGFAAATTNPFTVNIAQGIAEIPLNSGLGFRIVFYLCCLTLGIRYVLRYAGQIRKDPAAAIMPFGENAEAELSLEETPLTRRHVAIVVVGTLLFVGIVLAVQRLGWGVNEMSGGFILLGLATITISKMSLDRATKAFIGGLEEMIVAALVVGFARGIQVVMVDGQILDTIINHAATTLQQFPVAVAAAGMLVFQTTLNVFIPSGSGQAAVTMPLMAPLADLVGLTRQTAVFAYTCGDGFSNILIPTSGFLMAVLGIAKIPWVTWLRFVFPLFLQLMMVAFGFLMLAVVIGY